MGRVWSLGDNIDTDVITPTEYLDSREAYVAHALEPIRPEFGDAVEPGDVVVAGRNFGSGSSRESAAIAFLDNEVAAVIAESFSRIFFRNAINIGLPVYVLQEASEITEGTTVEIDHDSATIYDRSADRTYHAEEHPKFIREIIRLGGLEGYRNQQQDD
jgi:3-isopropylmalate/(R)-2-methylmalate dehydratase small subunit